MTAHPCARQRPHSVRGRHHLHSALAGAHSPDHTRRDSRHKGVEGHVADDDRLGGDHGPLADLDPAEDGGADPERHPAPHEGTGSRSPSPRDRLAGGDGAGAGVVHGLHPRGSTNTLALSVTPR
jgi:hypothetical protein